MKQMHFKCAGACGFDGHFPSIEKAASEHDTQMYAYEMPHDFRPVVVDDKTGKGTELNRHTGKPLNENTMKKSELKELLKVIVQEVVAAKQAQLNETKGLSGFKKSPESTEHTEKIAASKDLTGKGPKEKEEGKKLPVVKKPANPQKVGSIKEEILGMIREAISEADLDEMARVKGAVGAKFKVQDPSSPTGWVVKGHKTIPDGTPTEAPKGPYVPKGENPNMGRPKKASPTIGSDEVDDDEAAPEAGVGANSKVDVIIDGDKIGELDFAKIKGSVAGYLSSMLRANNFVLKLDPAVSAKLDEFSDLFVDDKLPAEAALNLALGPTSITLIQ